MSTDLSASDMATVDKVDQLLHVACVLDIDECVSLSQSVDIARNNYSVDWHKLFAKTFDFMEISIIWDIHKVNSLAEYTWLLSRSDLSLFNNRSC